MNTATDTTDTTDTTDRAWDGIDYREDWQDFGLTAAEARAWEMDPLFAHLWRDIGAEPETAHLLHDAGFDPQEAEWWITEGHDPAAVADASNAVRGDTTLQRWAEAGVDLDHAVVFVNAGIRVEERHLFADLDLLLTMSALRGNTIDGCRPSLHHPHQD